MSNTVSVVDETLGAVSPDKRRLERKPLRIDASRITARDLIRFRVEQEIERREEPSRRLAYVPPEPERALNEEAVARRSFSPGKNGGPEDILVAIAIAHEGFEAGRYLLVVNDRQIDDLDAEIRLSETNEACFVRLLPLQGG